MADSGSEDERGPEITVTLKSTSQNHQLTVSETSTVGKVKQLLSEKINEPVDKLCLIFSGKILKDHETLKFHNIKDGVAIHMVIRSNPAGGSTNTSRPAAAPTPASQPSGAAGAANNAGTGAGAVPNIPGMPPGFTMETARQMMNQPFFQNIMSNPEFLRSMISSNEQLQGLIRQNPEIGHLLNDPEIMRQTFEMIRNPNMFNEMMRNHDQAIRNLQGIPGGEAALQRLYTDIQEPLMNSATGGGNPFASGSGNDAAAESRSQRAGVENAEALPNPWGNNSQSRATTQPAPTNTSTSGGTGTGAAGPTNFADIANMMNMPGMREAMRNITPEMMRHALTPEVISQARSVFGDSMPSDADIQRMSQQFGTLLNDPEAASGLMNPAVITAMQNIRTNMEVIQREAPGLFRGMFSGMYNSLGNLPSTGTGAARTAPAPAPTGGANNASTTATDAAAGTGPNMFNMFAQDPNSMMEIFNQMMHVGNDDSSAPSPEERYRSQLDQLVGMGFTDREANIRAIQEAHGDVNGAIDRLLNR